MEDLSAFSARPRLAALLDHFAEIADTRQGWKVMYPLREVSFLVVCGTIASGDDYDDIVDWGKAHLAFLRGFAEFHFYRPLAMEGTFVEPSWSSLLAAAPGSAAGSLAPMPGRIGRNSRRVQACREGKLPLPDGTIIARLAWGSDAL
jgi:hypothetical protein